MKRLLVFTMIVLSSLTFFEWNSVSASGYHFFEHDRGGDIMDEMDAPYLSIDDLSSGVESNTIVGNLYSDYDVDYYIITLAEFAEVTIFFNDGLGYDIVMNDDQMNQWYWDYNTYSEQDLSNGVLLTPGSYFLTVYSDSQNVLPGYDYYIKILTDDNGWTPETFNVYEEVVDDTKAILWENYFQPDNDRCYYATKLDCALYYEFSYPHLDKRLYMMDKAFAFYVQAALQVVADEVSSNYASYSSINNVHDLVNTALSAVSSKLGGIGKAAGLALKAENLLFDAIAQEIMQDNLYHFLGEEYSTKLEAETAYKNLIEGYFDEAILADIFAGMIQNNDIEEFMDDMNGVASDMTIAVTMMRVDDVLYLDIYQSCNTNSGHYMTCEFDSVYFSASNTLPGSTGQNDGKFRLLYENDTINVTNKVFGHYGSFTKFQDSSTDVNDNLAPEIYFMFTEQGTESNYNNPYNFDSEEEYRLKLIDRNNPDPIATLTRGVTAFDSGVGFVSVTLDSHQGFDTFGIKQAVFSATDGYNTHTKTMYYRVYDYEEEYGVYEYQALGYEWQDTGSNVTHYFDTSYARTVYDGDTKRVYSSGTAQMYAKYDRYEYYDKVCFSIYKKAPDYGLANPWGDDGEYGEQYDEFKKTQCYYIDETPSYSDDADYFDYTTYHTSSSSTSTQTIYIGNSWYVSDIDGGTKRVYMDDRNSTADYNYFVKYTYVVEDNTKKLAYTSGYAFRSSYTDFRSGDNFYDYSYSTSSQGTYVDGYGILRSGYYRYRLTGDVYEKVYQYGFEYTGTQWFIDEPVNTSAVYYIRTSAEPRRIYE
jgi:hypothetical protein